MQSLFNLSGRVVLVTGATHGLGLAMAEGLGQAGARVVINGHSSQQKLSAAVSHLRDQGIDACGWLFDVTNETAVEQAVEEIESEIGPIYALFNNAGLIKRIPMLEMSLEDWNTVIHTDLTGVFVMTKPVVRRMIERGEGKVVNICSMMSELGRSTVAAYAAAKGGLKMLTKSMATEWAKHNIQINGIGPGYFATEQTAPIRVEGNPFNQFIIERTPAGRWGDPSDLKGAAVFLATPASDFVNGQIIYVDGGLLATIGRPSNEV